MFAEYLHAYIDYFAEYGQNTGEYYDMDHAFHTSSVIHDGIDPIKGTPYCADVCRNTSVNFARIYRLNCGKLENVMGMEIPDYIAADTENSVGRANMERMIRRYWGG